MNIFEHNAEYKRAKEIFEEEGIDEDVIRDTLEGLDGEFSFKMEQLANIKREEELENLAIQDEIERLQKLIERNNKAIERLDDYMLAGLKGYLLNHPKEKALKTTKYSFSVRHTQQTIINDQDKLIELAQDNGWIDCFKETTKVTVTPDKKVIKAYIESGVDFKGYATIVDNYKLSTK